MDTTFHSREIKQKVMAYMKSNFVPVNCKKQNKKKQTKKTKTNEQSNKEFKCLKKNEGEEKESLNF